MFTSGSQGPIPNQEGLILGIENVLAQGIENQEGLIPEIEAEDHVPKIGVDVLHTDTDHDLLGEADGEFRKLSVIFQK